MGRMNSIAGKLLVASPRLLDPNFYRAVVLIFVHDETDGALGLVLNREIDEPAERYLPEWADRISRPGLIHYGGPVEPEVAIGLGRAREGKGIGAAGLEMIDMTEPPNPDSPTVKVYSGYSGWAPGQLEAELEETRLAIALHVSRARLMRSAGVRR